MGNLTESKIMTLDEVQEYLVVKHKILHNERIKWLYNMIQNINVRVNDDDKEWVAFCTDPSENKTVVEAIMKIANENMNTFNGNKDDVAYYVDVAGEWFKNNGITHKPRIPFYVLVLDRVVGY